MQEQTVILRSVTSSDYTYASLSRLKHCVKSCLRPALVWNCIFCLASNIQTPRKITVCTRISLKWSVIDMVNKFFWQMNLRCLILLISVSLKAFPNFIFNFFICLFVFLFCFWFFFFHLCLQSTQANLTTVQQPINSWWFSKVATYRGLLMNRIDKSTPLYPCSLGHTFMKKLWNRDNKLWVEFQHQSSMIYNLWWCVGYLGYLPVYSQGVHVLYNNRRAG